MPNRPSSGPSGRGVFALMLLALTGAVGFGLYVRMTPEAAKVPPDMRREEEAAPAGEPVAQSGNTRTPEPSKATQRQAKRYFVATPNGESLRMKRLTKSVPDGEDARVFTANETLRELGLDRVQAKGIEIADGVATLDFNAEVAQGMGSMQEGQMLRALRMALGQFSEVESLRVAVNGQPVEELGHLEVADPLPVIRPSESP